MMRTDEELLTAYADLFFDGDETDLVSVVRDLEIALPVQRPPESLTLAFNQTLAERIESRSAVRRPFNHRLIPFGAARSTLSRQALGLAVLVLLIVALVGSVAYAASTFIRVEPPEQSNAVRIGSNVVGLFFPPPRVAQYRPIDPRRAAHESGGAVGYLEPPPGGFNVSVWIPVVPPLAVPTPRPAPGYRSQSVTNRSVVQYRRGNDRILVALDQPSAMLTQKPLVLGDHTVRLANGRLAWTTVMTGSEESNIVATVDGGFIIALASDLPMATVERLATRVVAIQASGKPGMQHIPANWPPPLPPQSAPAGTWIRLQPNEVRASEAGGHLHLTFMFSMGNIGAATARDIRTTIQLPSALTRHAIDTPPQWHFHNLATGSGVGFGGDMTVDVSGMSPAAVQTALVEGIEVRVTWLDAGKQRAHLYRFPVR